jgi:FKBP-type peptidyl-prolyl cis-trans isomerase
MRTAAVVASLAVLLAAPAAAQEPKSDAAKPEAGKPEASKPEAGKAEAQKPAAPAKVDTSKALYGLGLAVARSLDTFSLSPGELDQVIKGIKDGVSGKSKMALDQSVQTAVNDLARARAPKAAEKAATKEKETGAPYLAKMAKTAGAKKTPSGAIVIVEKEGTGAAPKDTDKVKVNYTGTLVNGMVFDSSQGRGPAEFPLNQVVKCWTEALQLMKVGGKAKIVCPSEIAYGERGSPPVIPGNAVLTFEVELLDIVK